MMRNWRGPVIILTALVVACLLGGAYLFVNLHEVTVKNSTLLCAFGKAINASPIERRAEESRRQFSKRVRITRVFARELGDLDDCPVHRIEVRVSRKDRPHVSRPPEPGKSRSGGNPRETPSEAVRRPPAASQGGDAIQSPPPQGNQQPGPPQGGPQDDGSGSSGEPPSQKPPPLLNVDPSAECQANAAGIEVCLPL